MGDLGPVRGKRGEVLVQPIEACCSLSVPEKRRIYMVHGRNQPDVFAGREAA